MPTAQLLITWASDREENQRETGRKGSHETCYRDLWMTKDERQNAAYYDIHTDDGGNTAKIRLGTADTTIIKPDASIAAAFGNRFAIPLDFEILTDHGLRTHLQ